MAETKKPLELVTEAMSELANIVSTQSPNVSVKKFAEACSLFSGLFGILETSFKFAKIDYNAKVNDLTEASKTISTIEVMVNKDIEGGCVKRVGSHTRNLLRVKRALETTNVLFLELVASQPSDSALKDAAIKAYNQVLFPYHGYAIQKAANTGSPHCSYLPCLIG